MNTVKCKGNIYELACKSHWLNENDNKETYFARMREVWLLLIYQSGRLPSSRLVPFAQSKLLHSTRSLHTRARVIHIFCVLAKFSNSISMDAHSPYSPHRTPNGIYQLLFACKHKRFNHVYPLYSAPLHSILLPFATLCRRTFFTLPVFVICIPTYMAVSAKIHPFMFMNGNENFCFLAIVLLLLVL